MCGALLLLQGCRYPRSDRPAGMSWYEHAGYASSHQGLGEPPLPRLGCRRGLRVEISGHGWGELYVECESGPEESYAYSRRVLSGSGASAPVTRPVAPDFYDVFACHAVTLQEEQPIMIDGTSCSFEVVVDGVFLIGNGHEGSPLFEQCVQLLRETGVFPEETQSVALASRQADLDRPGGSLR